MPNYKLYTNLMRVKVIGTCLNYLATERNSNIIRCFLFSLFLFPSLFWWFFFFLLFGWYKRVWQYLIGGFFILCRHWTYVGSLVIHILVGIAPTTLFWSSCANFVFVPILTCQFSSQKKGIKFYEQCFFSIKKIKLKEVLLYYDVRLVNFRCDGTLWGRRVKMKESREKIERHFGERKWILALYFLLFIWQTILIS